MKKNKMMRLASALLVAVLLTTCAISGTFAKYVTKAYGTDQARVAKWGFETTLLTVDLFKDLYDGGAVDSNNTDKVIAPGTTNTCEIVLIPGGQGAPEVKYHFDANIDIVAANTNDTLFAQLEWKLGDGAWGTFADLKAAINAQYDKDYAPNTLPDAANKTITIAWRWNYSDGSDVTDTALGNDGTLKVQVEFTFVATQLDN
jgi:hypothetical protein